MTELTNSPSDGDGVRLQAVGRYAALLKAINNPSVARIATIGVLLAASLAGGATYFTFSDAGVNAARDSDHLVTLIYVDLVLLLALTVIVARKLVHLWSERRQGAAGSKMHVRLVAMFGALSITPAIIVAGFSLFFFNFGLESWFSDRVRTAVLNSAAIAEAYLEEHLRNIEADALWIANNLNRESAAYSGNPRLLEQRLQLHANLRQLPEALIFEDGGPILARAGLTVALEFELISNDAMTRARQGEVVMLRSESGDRVRAIIRLETIIDSFLIVGQSIDPVVLGEIAATETAAAQYQRLEGERSQFQIFFALAFMMVSLLLLLSAIWIGLNVATGLSAPISRLIGATERVRGGDFSATVETSERNDEIDVLGRAFNRMTQQLTTQRDELIHAGNQAEERRRFTETVLAGVSAGVIGLDQDGHIDLANRRASDLLGVALEEYFGQDVHAVAAELSPLVARARSAGDAGFIEEELQIGHEGNSRKFLVRIGPLRQTNETLGYVLTIDDVTALASAQRKAAWADVARRIAHEIKNPLTPIQLSAERLKRKYLKDIDNDPQVFETCVDTIIRQVGDIGEMVDEFSSFARMPAPTIQRIDLSDLCRQQVFLQRNGNPDVSYDLTMPDDPVMLNCDARQVAQILTNLLKNAYEAIDGREKSIGSGEKKGWISVTVKPGSETTTITIRDDGVGLPRENRDRLTEPYVTTRDKGTGLGLAIVKKIMEDHGGTLVLGDNETGQGAKISLVFGSGLGETKSDLNPTEKKGLEGHADVS